MRYSEVSKRYAKALYELARENGTQERVLEELRALQKIVQESEEIQQYLASPVVPSRDREKVLTQAISGQGLSEEVQNMIFVLTRKNRLPLLAQIAEAYQDQSDAAHSMIRGMVESAIRLEPNEREQLTRTVRQVTGKEVILNYKINPKIIGGMVANVGGYTFDDSIQSHLRRLNEDLKRRVN